MPSIPQSIADPLYDNSRLDQTDRSTSLSHHLEPSLHTHSLRRKFPHSSFLCFPFCPPFAHHFDFFHDHPALYRSAFSLTPLLLFLLQIHRKTIRHTRRRVKRRLTVHFTTTRLASHSSPQCFDSHGLALHFLPLHSVPILPFNQFIAARSVRQPTDEPANPFPNPLNSFLLPPNRPARSPFSFRNTVPSIARSLGRRAGFARPIKRVPRFLARLTNLVPTLVERSFLRRAFRCRSRNCRCCSGIGV